MSSSTHLRRKRTHLSSRYGLRKHRNVYVSTLGRNFKLEVPDLKDPYLPSCWTDTLSCHLM